MWDGGFFRAAGEPEKDFVGILEAESDDVAVLQFAAFHFFAVDVKPAALAAILDVKTVGFDDDGGAIARNAAVGKLQVVAGFGSPADQERSLRHSNVAARAIRGDDFENGILA